jgi:hypothetical protein
LGVAFVHGAEEALDDLACVCHVTKYSFDIVIIQPAW